MAKTTNILRLIALGLCITNVAFSEVPNFAPYIVLKGVPRFAPFFDVTQKTGPTLADVSLKSNQKDFTLAFVLGGDGDLGCEPMWGGKILLNDSGILGPIKAIQAQGGEMIVATGGPNGPYLERMCTDEESLSNAYLKILDTVESTHLDVIVGKGFDKYLVNGALLKCQEKRPDTTFSYSLMVKNKDYGFTAEFGLDVLKSAVEMGVTVDVVNALTMEFDRPFSSTWGESVVEAGKSVIRQVQDIFGYKFETEPKRMIGVTVRIGKNLNGKIMETADARHIVNWANENGIGYLRFDSAGRDNGNCPGGDFSPNCSSVSQQDFEFTKIFQGFKG